MIFHLNPSTTLYFGVHKKIKIVYLDPRIVYGYDKEFGAVSEGWPHDYSILAYLKRVERYITIHESPLSSKKKQLYAQSRVIKKIDKDASKNKETTTTGSYIGDSSSQLGIAILTAFLRIFHIIDLMINFFGKVNVEMSPMIDKFVNILRKT